MTSRDTAFHRKLEQLVISRLRGGQTPESLLEDLKARLEPSAAEAMLARAEARLASGEGKGWARVLTWIAYVWTVVLVLQNVGVMYGAVEGIQATSVGPPDSAYTVALSFALLNIGLLCAGVFAFKRWPSAYSTAAFALIIVYAFPIAPYVERWLIPAFGPPALGMLTSVSALCSYLAAGLIVLAHWRDGKAAPTAPEAAAAE